MLELRGIEKRLGEFTVSVDEMFDGITALIGPSGSGKTTLLNIIAGLVRPEKGRVILNGRDITGLPPEKRKVGYVFQDYALFPHMTVRENILYAGDNLEVAEILGIDHLLDRKVHELSGGEKQRTALARALAGNPEVLLLDEPMSSVDEFLRKRLTLELSAVLRTLDVPVIYVTHSIREALVVADEIAVMRSGEIVQKGRTEEVYEYPRNRFVAEFTGFENVFRGRIAEKGSDGTVIEWSEGVVHAGECEFEEGEEVFFAVRPEYVMVIREGKELGRNLEGNVFPGRIVSRMKVGPAHEVLVSLRKERVVVVIPDHAYHRLEIERREEIKIGFKRNRIRVFRP